MPSEPEKDSSPIDVVDLSSSSDDEEKEKEKEKEKPSDAPSLIPTHQGQSIESRSFWRAGAYDVVSNPTATSQGQLEHARVHPKFLHSNATSHKWAFGAIAELLDNAVDEICHGATFVKVDRIYNARDDSPALLFQDDGGGMDPECMRQCLSLGYSSKKTNTTIGQYGNGFKTSTMRLGADAIVFSCATRGSHTTQSIGLLSYTFLRRTGQDDIIVPMVDFEVFGDRVQPMFYSSQNDWTNNLEIILEWSPFTTKAELLLQFEDIEPHGTKVIVYNLWHNDDGVLELDFDDDEEDIRLRDEAINGGLSKSQRGLAQSHISYRLRYSLRAYASILYLREFTDFRIILRGKPVQQLYIEDELKFSKVIPYKPQLGITSREVTVETTIGFLKEAPILKVYGFNIYHKNRLIMPFWKVIHEGSSRGKGVVGVLEANFIEPAHDKQDFERTALFIRLEMRLKQMLLDYWKTQCHLLGYQQHSSANAHNVQEIPVHLPSIGHESNLQELPFDQPVIGLAANLPREFPIEEPVIGLAANFRKELPTVQPIIELAAMGRINSVEGNGYSDTMASAGHHETDFSQRSDAEVAQSEKGHFKELASLDGSGSTLVDKICEENIQLFMRCEEHRQKEADLKQMIDKLEAELEETRRKCSQLRSNMENRRKQ